MSGSKGAPTLASSGAQAASIELRWVTKTFGTDVHAVREVSLAIEPGEFVALLGPSGSGKTTLLRSIAGFEDITRGEILIDGESIAHVPTHQRRLGMVAQDYALFPHMNVRDNLSFGLKGRSPAGRKRLTRARIEDRVREMLDLVGLDGFADRKPHQLSGGQKQRVALARALVTEPRVLLLDEPFAALDKQLREQMQVEVRRVQQRLGITTVFVTHDQSEALSMSDRVAVLNLGRLEQFDAPERIYDEPSTRFVAGFVGRTNVFPACVHSVADGVAQLDLRDGTTVSVRTSHHPAVGAEVEFSVRPERLGLVLADSQRDPALNEVDGVISHTAYLGDRVDVLARTSTGEVTVSIPRREVGSTPFNHGAAVRVTFSENAAALLPDTIGAPVPAPS